jgi:hypothetical protein
MLSFIVLTFVNLVILLAPPGSVRILLELMRLPFHTCTVLLFVVLFNVLVSIAFERWGYKSLQKWLVLLCEFTRTDVAIEMERLINSLLPDRR